jgi:chromate transporter
VTERRAIGSAAEVFVQALGLGLTSFGGPIAHIGYFERTYVRRLGWLDHAAFARLFALVQILPGPASSQLGFLIGYRRAGAAGALAAWLGFTLPSALLLFAFARIVPSNPGPIAAGALHGLELAAVAIVAQALVAMARRLEGIAQAAIAIFVAVALIALDGAWAGVAAIAAGALVGALACRDARPVALDGENAKGRHAAVVALIALVALAIALAIAAIVAPRGRLALAAAFFRAGALVFGGGHVVLPLLHDALVPAWMNDDAFLAGYGAAQAVPGPLFAVAAYYGAIAHAPAGGAGTAVLTLIALFAPGLLLALSGLRVLDAIAALPRAAAAIAGVNAAVVGLLAAAWYAPVLTTSVHDVGDAAVALLALVLLQRAHAPPLAAVLFAVVCLVARAAFA